MVTVGAVQEGLAPLALLARGLEDSSRLRVQGASAAREPIFQVEAEGRNRGVKSGSRGIGRLSHPPWGPAPAHPDPAHPSAAPPAEAPQFLQAPAPPRSSVVGLCSSSWG